MKRAQEAEAKAQQTRLMAEAARGEAEKLIVYLLDDFYLELEPVGRLDIVGALAKRAHRLLQRAAAGAAHRRDRAQPRAGAGALRRRRCAPVASSTKATRRSTEAVEVLGKLREGGRSLGSNRHRARRSGLSQARVADSRNRTSRRVASSRSRPWMR